MNAMIEIVKRRRKQLLNLPFVIYPFISMLFVFRTDSRVISGLDILVVLSFSIGLAFMTLSFVRHPKQFGLALWSRVYYAFGICKILALMFLNNIRLFFTIIVIIIYWIIKSDFISDNTFLIGYGDDIAFTYWAFKFGSMYLGFELKRRMREILFNHQIKIAFP